MNSGQNDNNKFEDKQPFHHIVHDENTVKQEFESNKISVFHAPKLKKKRKNRSLVSTLLTILAASIIGVLFGVGILQMFVVLNDQPVASETAQDVSQPAAAGEQERQTTSFQIPKLSAYIVQAGVFSEMENADEWQLEFAGRNIPALVWETEQQYYLFTGVFETEETARIKIDEFGEDIELFIKTWETAPKEVDATDEEVGWLTQFHTTWSEGLAAKETAGFSDLPAITKQSDLLHEISNYIETEQSDGNEEQFYLDLMYLYEQLGKGI